MRRVRNKKPGFTLIEIAIILVILGLLAGMTIPLLSELTKHQHYKSTQKDLDEIKTALAGFAGMYWRLPYADSDNDGLENTGQVSGYLPYITLGLGAVDSWRNRYYYDVNSRLVTTTNQSTFCTALQNIGANEKPRLAFSAGGTPAPQALVVISRGENSTLDGGNTPFPGDRDYESHPPSDTFDDLVAAFSPSAFSGRLNCSGAGGGVTCNFYTIFNRRNNAISIQGGNYILCTTIASRASFTISTGETITIYNNANCAGNGETVNFNNCAATDSDGDCLARWTTTGLADE